jgi:uncharacterized membrane protein
MDTILWIVQVLVALAFVMAGSMKVIRPKEQLAKMMAWVEHFSATQVKLIGAAEVLGGLGAILPGLTHIGQFLTPLAGAGLSILMIGAAYTHLRLKENSKMGAPIVLLVLALVVTVGRLLLPLP